MIGYIIIGPLMALCASVAYSANAASRLQQEHTVMIEKIESLEKRLDDSDKETLRKVMTTVMPIAKAVNKLNQEVGL